MKTNKCVKYSKSRGIISHFLPNLINIYSDIISIKSSCSTRYWLENDEHRSKVLWSCKSLQQRKCFIWRLPPRSSPFFFSLNSTWKNEKLGQEALRRISIWNKVSGIAFALWVTSVSPGAGNCILPSNHWLCKTHYCLPICDAATKRISLRA